MLSAVLLIIAISIDAFAVSITYGIKKIKIPFVSAMIISLTGTGFLLLSLFLAKLVTNYIDKSICTILSIILLMTIGFTDLFQSSIKSYLRKHKGQANVSFSVFNISFAVDIFLDETKADRDNSKTLSAKEAIMLAIALSVDSLATGFSAGLSITNILAQIVMCFFAGIIFCLAGRAIGEKIQAKSRIDLSWLSGVILIILAISKSLRL